MWTQAISSAPGAQRLDLMDAYTTGFYFGVLAYFAVLGAVYWFVGRWGWIGIAIRAVVIGPGHLSGPGPAVTPHAPLTAGSGPAHLSRGDRFLDAFKREVV